MARFINIHSHRPAGPGEWCLQNIMQKALLKNSEQPVSFGLHPWLIEPARWEQQLDDYINEFKNPVIAAIGECGLDKACLIPWELQLFVFRAQATEANRLGKPIIIHCVRAYQELLILLNSLALRVPCLFHGFAKNETLGMQILHQGHYLSFGHHILHKDSYPLLQTIDASRFFLETDQAQVPIQMVYERAASERNLTTDRLLQQQEQNLFAIFGLQLNQ